jgi:hypothetical protein
MALLDLLNQINWAISLLGAVLLSVIANLVTPIVKNWIAAWSRSSATARIEELESELQKISKYSNSQELSYLVSTSILQVLVFFSLASALTTLGYSYISMLNSYSQIILNFMIGITSTFLYLLGFIRSFKALNTINKVRYLDEYKVKIEESIASLREKRPSAES